jgi:hypothetical protein
MCKISGHSNSFSEAVASFFIHFEGIYHEHASTIDHNFVACSDGGVDA